ncbi:ABC transporter permease [Clostridium hydrogenum]|uniref:ABC transporter permease n=1 Tax=Clostridium hydrogenum TaxID=2855764 RepID=UPI001F363137|nr:ABC-2 family transporter protein [Clostridium hydrogenum]
MEAYLYKLKMQIIVNITYRFEVFATIATRFILMVSTVFLWKCTYAGNKEMLGLSKSQMITYSVLSVFLSSVFQCNVQNTIRDGVRQGKIAVDLLRPYNIIVAFFAQDLGDVFASILNKALPLLFLGMIFFGVNAPVSSSAFVLFVISSVLGFMILWFISALVGMFSFWTLELGNMGVVKDIIVSILSGSLIPLWFFPNDVQKVLAFMPFQYTYQTPMGLYIGKITINDGLLQIGIQIIWILLLGVITSFVWCKAKNNILIQGG